MSFTLRLKNIIKKSKQIKSIVRYFKLRKMLKFPMQVQIETTSVCNSRCVHCGHRNLARLKAHMPFELFKKIIDDCAPNKKYIKRLALFFMGEPFLAPDIFKEIAYAKEKGISNVFLISNGGVLDQEKSEKLLESGLNEIVFSIDGATKETFEKIRVGLNFDQVISNITNFIKLKDEKGKDKPKVIIDMVVTPQAEKETKQLYEKWKELGVEVAIRPMHYFEGMDKDLAAYLKKQEKSKIEDFPCPYLWKNIQILQDGRVAMCCMDVNGRHILGDINQSSIKEIWQGEALNKYRQLHLQNKGKEIDICVNCDFYKVKSKPWWWF